MISFAVQLGVLILFQELDVQIDAVYGNGLGKLIANFFYKLTTFEETVSRAVAITKNKHPSNILDKITDFQVSLEGNFLKETSIIEKQKPDSLTIDELPKRGKRSILVVNISDTSLDVNTLKFTDLSSFLNVLGR